MSPRIRRRRSPSPRPSRGRNRLSRRHRRQFTSPWLTRRRRLKNRRRSRRSLQSRNRLRCQSWKRRLPKPPHRRRPPADSFHRRSDCASRSQAGRRSPPVRWPRRSVHRFLSRASFSNRPRSRRPAHELRRPPELRGQAQLVREGLRVRAATHHRPGRPRRACWADRVLCRRSRYEPSRVNRHGPACRVRRASDHRSASGHQWASSGPDNDLSRPGGNGPAHRRWRQRPRRRRQSREPSRLPKA